MPVSNILLWRLRSKIVSDFEPFGIIRNLHYELAYAAKVCNKNVTVNSKTEFLGTPLTFVNVTSVFFELVVFSSLNLSLLKCCEVVQYTLEQGFLNYGSLRITNRVAVDIFAVPSLQILD